MVGEGEGEEGRGGELLQESRFEGEGEKERRKAASCLIGWIEATAINLFLS